MRVRRIGLLLCTLVTACNEKSGEDLVSGILEEPEPAIVSTIAPPGTPALLPAPPPPTYGGGHPPEGFERVRVYFGTNRGRSLDRRARRPFDTTRGPMSYGVCEISVPPSHEAGELESPSLLRFEFREDPTEHVVLLDVTTMEKADFLTELRARVDTSSRNALFVFIHGYNVTFEDAARRTAQIWYDLSYDGAPVFFSWPSAESITGYVYDKESIRWAQLYLKAFLVDVASQTDAENIHLIAHSMGTQLLTETLRELGDQDPAIRARFREIILSAPDIDATVFKEQIAPRLSAFGANVTIYASAGDKALQASKRFQGYPRLGDASEGIVIVPGIDTIDATGVKTSFLGHSYFADEFSILNDMYYLIEQGIRAEERFGLTRVETPSGPYWVMGQ